MNFIANEDKINVISDETSINEFIKHVVKTTNISNPFYILDIHNLVNNIKTWKNNLPRVKPFYAVKCNDNVIALKIFAAFDFGFDCFTEGEIKKVLDLGVNPSRIIFANPTKILSHVKFAKNKSVNLTVFDNEMELDKMKSTYELCKLLIRIRSDALTCKSSPFGIKFGCDPVTEAPKLLSLAYNLGLSVVGVSFHVGSGCNEPEAYRRAILASANVFSHAKKIGFKNMHILDIGGGFHGKIDKFAGIINEALDELFPPDSGVNIIAEPGRYFVESSFTLTTQIHSIKRGSCNGEIMYFINDGIYGSFMDILIERAKYIPKPLTACSDELVLSSLWGPTADSIDLLMKSIYLPRMNIGDYIIFENMGSYCRAIATTFNGFNIPKVYAVVNHQTFTSIDNG
ncbi:ornithine decarboxylase-like isoform X2 [Daktulosphaira vitifoliae]|uniref:ornithine decarboxylase-like isoform X2 n=1 Tax=Daktulosphaira vitifoliae TaxID=58002 RepID=UPI0021A9B1B6|nr:ornithine decarboxylase-like isoform X2 [Daktulosphaira vitifoliae]